MKRRITDKIDFFKKNITETHSWTMIIVITLLYSSSLFFLKEYMTAIEYYGVMFLGLTSVSMKVMLKNVSYAYPDAYYLLSIILEGVLFIWTLSLVGVETQAGMAVYMMGFVMVTINILTLNCFMIGLSGVIWVLGYTLLHVVINTSSVDGIFIMTIIITIVYTSVLTYISKVFQKMRLKALS